MKARILAAALVLGVLPTLACDKIPGLGKKDGGDEGGAGGGVLSFLGGTFEGEITSQVSGKGTGKTGPMTMTFGIKTPKVRIDLAGAGVQDNPMLAQGAGFIIDPPAKKGYMLMPAQKKAMVIDFEKAKAQRQAHPAGQPGAPGAISDPPKIEKTGKKAVVAGYTCDEWKVTTKTSRADMCVAEGIKWMDLTDLGMSSPELGFAAAASDFNHFPLRVVAYDDKNVETTRMEATKIDKKKLDDSRFTVPPDYQVIDMSAMLGNLQNLGAGGKPGAGLPPGFVPPSPKAR